LTLRSRAGALAAALVPLLTLVAAMLVLPPLGALVGGQPLGQFLSLPLDVRTGDPLPLDRPVFAVFSAGVSVLVIATLWFARPRRPLRESGVTPRTLVRAGRFPRWGAWGALAAGAAMAAAMGGMSGASQPLLVLGLTLLLAAHTEWRSGISLVRQRPGFFLLLYPASALLGWLFHWVNLFLQLWVYPGAGADSAIPFVLVRTLDYATLLPALLVLRQWLASWRPLLDWCTRSGSSQGFERPQSGWLSIGAASIGLAGSAVWPDWIWPLTWVSPVLLVMGIQQLGGKSTLFSGTRRGDWSRILIPALAALLLGLLIQGWNVLVGPVWTFNLPLIQARPLFGLPLPAYAGLLPLGLLGVWCADQLAHPWRQRLKDRFPAFPVRISVSR